MCEHRCAVVQDVDLNVSTRWRQTAERKWIHRKSVSVITDLFGFLLLVLFYLFELYQCDEVLFSKNIHFYLVSLLSFGLIIRKLI